MQTDHASPAAAQPPDLPPYRAVSPLSIVACLLAVTSALALVHPVLWCVPVVAVAVALAALRSIARQPDTLVGRQAALAALAIAVFFGTWAPAQLTVRRIVIPRHARQFAEYWLSLLCEGRVYEAHQWTEDPSYRVPADVDLREFYQSDSDAKQRLEEYLSNEPVRSLVRLGREAQPLFVRTVDVEGGGKSSLAVLIYDVRSPQKPTVPLTIQIAVERTAGSGGKPPQWRVDRVGLPRAAAR